MDNLFINLIDTNLQNWIAQCDILDKDAMYALSILLNESNHNSL